MHTSADDLTMLTRWSEQFDSAPSVGPRPEQLRSLAELLALRAEREPERCSHVFLDRSAGGVHALTYSQLRLRVSALAARLHHVGVRAGDRVLVMTDFGLPSVVAIYACLWSGGVAVPTPPIPERVNRILSDCGPTAVLFDQNTAKSAQLIASASRSREAYLNIDDELKCASADGWSSPSELAVLQYTSGSTAEPKGVMVTHQNLQHLLTITEQCAGYDANTRLVSWLPTFHDLGLIGGVLQPVFSGFPVALWSPLAFMSQPLRWLQAMSAMRATSSAAPNFAFDLCVRRFKPDVLEHLDLRSVDSLICAGEPVQSATLTRFVECFAKYGLRHNALQPAYGLAEATLQTAMEQSGRGAVTRHVDTSALRQGVFEAVSDQSADSSPLVSSGVPVQRTEIIDPASQRRCRPGAVGEIWIKSPAVAAGYWGRPGQTQATFGACVADTGEGPFLRTGDLGVLSEGQLFVTGRLKDVIIVRGENHWPQDIEASVQAAHPAVRPGGVAAFSAPQGAAHDVVIVAELNRAGEGSISEVTKAINMAIKRRHQLRAKIVLTAPHTVPKTTSGKLQRSACRDALTRGAIEVLGTQLNAVNI